MDCLFLRDIRDKNGYKNAIVPSFLLDIDRIVSMAVESIDLKKKEFHSRTHKCKFCLSIVLFRAKIIDSLIVSGFTRSLVAFSILRATFRLKELVKTSRLCFKIK